MSTCSDHFGSQIPFPVKTFEYPCALDAGNSNPKPLGQKGESETPSQSCGVPPVTENDLATAYEKGRWEGHQESERKFKEQLAHAVTTERSRVSKVIEEFHQASSEYYSKVEDQVVHLALGIAAKILHRESQVDPLLIAALVRVATDNLKQGSNVQVNIRPEEISSWRSYFERDGNVRVKIELVEDPSLSPGDCIVHSEVGVASLGISAQLKEIERGLFDLLAQRPKND
jgi:flagellar assembly protein FliH